MSAPTVERLAIENVVRDLVEQGYEVLQEPSRTATPEFLAGYRPDLIAFKEPGPNLVVEVKRRGQKSATNLAEIRRRFKGHSDWQFSVVWVEPMSGAGGIDLSSAQEIHDRTTEAVGLVEAGYLRPALLICWALLEGIARSYLPDTLQKPQAPRSVVQALEGEGFIDAEEATFLRRLAEARNRLIHGVVGEDVEESDVRDFLAIIQHLIRDLATTSFAADED